MTYAMPLIKIILSFALILPLSLTQAQVLQDENNNIDPLESINRPLFALNNGLDRFLIRPAAQVYHIVMPDIGERGVGNFFANLYDANAAINALLQWRLDGAAQSGGRFLVNSTAGFLGFIDVATPIGIRPYRTDFGHTLAIWGFEPGPYIMVPLLGPRTIRSGVGTLADFYLSPQGYLIDDFSDRAILYTVEIIDGRARFLNTDELISGDKYIFVRDVYLQNRRAYINGGVIEDSFSSGDDEEWDEDF